MEIVELAGPAQVIAFVALFTYLAVAYMQVRTERTVYSLMTTEVEISDEDDAPATYSHSHSSQSRIGGATEWELLDWDQKMRFLRLEQRLNWAAALAGVITVFCGLIWGYAEVYTDWDEGLGIGWLSVLSVLFILGMIYILWTYYERARRQRQDYLQMKDDDS